MVMFFAQSKSFRPIWDFSHSITDFQIWCHALSCQIYCALYMQICNDNVVNYVMRWDLAPSKQVKWLIQYSFPVFEKGENRTSQTQTFLTSIAKQRRGIHKRERKLELYMNIFVSWLWSFNDLPWLLAHFCCWIYLLMQ